MLNAIVCFFYLATALLCMRAALAAGRKSGKLRDQSGKLIRDQLLWLVAAGFFCGLIFLRSYGLEEMFRNAIRSELIREGSYAGRRGYQSLLAAGFFLVIPAVCMVGWNFRRNAGKRAAGSAVRWASLGMAIMICLLILRLISFHATDQLLYGPLHFNWFLDLGATLLTGWAAVRHVQGSAVTDANHGPAVRRKRV